MIKKNHTIVITTDMTRLLYLIYTVQQQFPNFYRYDGGTLPPTEHTFFNYKI